MSSRDDYAAAQAAGTTVGHEWARQREEIDLFGEARRVLTQEQQPEPDATGNTGDPDQIEAFIPGVGHVRALSRDDKDELQKYFSE